MKKPRPRTLFGRGRKRAGAGGQERRAKLLTQELFPTAQISKALGQKRPSSVSALRSSAKLPCLVAGPSDARTKPSPPSLSRREAGLQDADDPHHHHAGRPRGDRADGHAPPRRKLRQRHRPSGERRRLRSSAEYGLWNSLTSVASVWNWKFRRTNGSVKGPRANRVKQSTSFVSPPQLIFSWTRTRPWRP